jgi:hypothetical protein
MVPSAISEPSMVVPSVEATVMVPAPSSDRDAGAVGEGREGVSGPVADRELSVGRGGGKAGAAVCDADRGGVPGRGGEGLRAVDGGEGAGDVRQVEGAVGGRVDDAERGLESVGGGPFESDGGG